MRHYLMSDVAMRIVTAVAEDGYTKQRMSISSVVALCGYRLL